MTVKHALLALLVESPRYGLQLKQEFESRTGEIWPLNVGQVYSTLDRLVRDGFISASSEGDAARKVYEIEPDGLEMLHGWLQTSSLGAPPRDELVLKILVAVTLPDIDVGKLIQSHRSQLLKRMQHYTKLKQTDEATVFLLVLDAEIFKTEAAVRWLDTVEVRIAQGLNVDLPLAAPNTLEESSEPLVRSADEQNS